MNSESRLTQLVIFAIGLLLALSFTGCASFQSNMKGAYPGEGVRNPNPKPVSVVFIFSHVRQTIGYDAIPKLQPKRRVLRGFDDIFLDALREFNNVGSYATFTEEADDVNQQARRAKRDSLMQEMDYTVRIRIETTKRFSTHFLGTLFSSISGTLLPIPYTTTYTMKTTVLNRENVLTGEYEREVRITKWVEALLIFAYPFYPEARVREEVYMRMMHDTFLQIESDHVLTHPGG